MKTRTSKEFVVESGFPMPPRKGGKSGHVAELIRSMNIGDSFLMPKGKQAGNACTSAKFAGYKLATRKMDDGRVRVWRIE